MNTIERHRAQPPGTVLAVVIALASAGILLASAQPAQARERHTTVTGANGQQAQRNVTRAQGDVSSTTTGPNGKTASRQVERSASGATATVTGPNGKTATRVTTRQP
jgi:type II secretory pathway pseudopilin PulG